MRRGEVRWYTFKAPDKRRPVLILTRDSILPHLNEVTVAPLTTTIRDIPTEVILTPADDVPEECAVNCDHIQTVAQARVGKLITTLSSFQMEQVSRAVNFALDL